MRLSASPIGIGRRGAGNLPVLITAANLKPFINIDLEETAKTWWPLRSARRSSSGPLKWQVSLQPPLTTHPLPT